MFWLCDCSRLERGRLLKVEKKVVDRSVLGSSEHLNLDARLRLKVGERKDGH